MGSAIRPITVDLPAGATPEIGAALRQYVPTIAKEAVDEIERELPTFARPQDVRYAEVLGQAVEWSIGHFLDLMAEPGASSEEILEFFRLVGVGEAREGRTIDPLQAALRIGAGVAVRRLTEEAERSGHDITPGIIAQVAQAVLTYLDRLADVVAEGHAEARARAAGELQGRRHRLLDLLIGPSPAQLGAIKELAADADWPIPRTVAAVALYGRGPDAHRPSLPADVLVGLHLDEPCLILPDPEGPGRPRMLETALRDWVAAIGPTVEVSELAKSLRWARRTLALAHRNVIGSMKPITVTEHMPIMVMMQDRELIEHIAARRLAPLMELRPVTRYRLAQTLLASLECGFNATDVSVRLRVHAQTIRYRLRQIEGLFGDDIHDPEQRLELHMLLHAWIATRREPDADLT